MNRLAVITSHLPTTEQQVVPCSNATSWSPDRAPPMLAGLKVVELATIIAGPASCSVLADFGADVIKIERPGGDVWRGDRAAKTPTDPWGGPHFAHNNRGKRSVVLDLKKTEHLDALMDLLATADVFVTNVRRQALEKMGLDYPTLRKRFPRLIYAILTAWGLSGPRAADPGYDVGAFWAASGLQDFSKPTDQGHVGQFPPGIGDHLTAMQLVAGIGLALWYRDRTGKGQMVEGNLLRSGIWGMSYALVNTALNPGGKFIREPRTQHYRPTFNVYKCSDGVWLQLLGLDIGRFDRKLCAALGLDYQTVEPLDNKGRIALFDKTFITQPSVAWEKKLNEHGVWYQRAVQLDEVLRDEQAHAVGTFTQLPATSFPIINSPLQMGCSDQHGPKGPPPVCGEHTEEVLKGLGYTPDKARRMAAETQKWSRGHNTD